jgi:hypothetical protein
VRVEGLALAGREGRHPIRLGRTVGFDGGARTRFAPPRSPGLSDRLKPGQAS